MWAGASAGCPGAWGAPCLFLLASPSEGGVAEGRLPPGGWRVPRLACRLSHTLQLPKCQLTASAGLLEGTPLPRGPGSVQADDAASPGWEHWGFTGKMMFPETFAWPSDGDLFWLSAQSPRAQVNVLALRSAEQCANCLWGLACAVLLTRRHQGREAPHPECSSA